MLKRVQKVKDALTRLPDLEDAQMEATLLRNCLALPKISFALRSCPPHHVKDAISSFDQALLEALSDLAGGPLPHWSWLKASLPAALGGLGIRRASLHASAAYVSSLDQSQELVAGILGRVPPTSDHLPTALQDLARAAQREDWTCLEEVDVHPRQRCLSRSVDQAVFDEVCSSAPDTRSRALALSSAIPHAGDWLNVIPSKAFGLHLFDWAVSSVLAGPQDG